MLLNITLTLSRCVSRELKHLRNHKAPKKILVWKHIGTRIRGRPRKRWIVDIEEDMQIMGIRQWRKNVKKEQNRRESLRRQKPIVGCNASKRRRRRRRRRRTFMSRETL